MLAILHKQNTKVMKKIILLLSLVFICSCSSDDSNSSNSDTNPNNQKYHITPPDWILGEWSDGQGRTIEFTKSNVTIDYYGNFASVDYQLNNYYEDGDTQLIQTQTSTTYNIQFYDSPSTKKIYNFIKISDTQIESTGLFKGTYTKK
ncbi:hypothetical protein ABXT06_11940 [Flavobacterium sp. UW10123]|uniref:hypothetical protein n=1 Tax=Flavobacterium sp. UW10123 TaxID=3230800 RepID=UPI0033934737